MEEPNDLPKSTYPYWAKFTLNNPLRRRFINREKLVSQAGIEKGQTVFELGFGVGFFTEFIAKAIGPDGVLYSQDVEPRMLDTLKENMQHFAISSNINPIIASSTNVPLEDGSVDLIFAANVFEEIEKEGLLNDSIAELKRISREGAKLFFMEHIGGVGLPRISAIEKALDDAGFKQVSHRKTRFNVYGNYVLKK